MFSVDEYLRIERAAPQKSELLEGLMWKMGTASENHILVCRNLSTAFHVQLRGSECISFASLMKVRTPGGVFYPDLTIACGQRLFYDSARDVLMNPGVIVEIMSPSSEDFDRGEKLRMYQQIETLHDLLLVSESEPRIEHWIRQGGQWRVAEPAVGLQSIMTLNSPAVTLALADVYENVRF